MSLGATVTDPKQMRADALSLLSQLASAGVHPTGLADDSRQIQAGHVFLAYPGSSADGRRYIGEAIQRGASAVLWAPESFEMPADCPVPHMPAKGLRALSGWLANAIAGWPSERMPVLAITGTNGKTTISQWLAQAYPRPCGAIGTLGVGFPGQTISTGFTTPEAPRLVQALLELQAQGAEGCALEASSIGLAEGRMNGLHIDTAIFTNCTRDHLDYHGDMASYAAAKSALFSWHHLRFAVINVDDPLGRQLMRETTAAKLVGTTLLPAERSNFPALIRADAIEDTPMGQRFQLHCPLGQLSIETRLLGRYNISNLLAVAAVLIDAGIREPKLGELLSGLTPPPGRMESYGGKEAPLVVVDYAHTPDALENALTALRPVALARQGQLQVIFGCGGGRDAGKRPLMGEVAARHADRVWLSSDNPRYENPQDILKAVALGAPSGIQIADRAKAIATALAEANPNDVILLAGKGHETTQEIAGEFLPFHDGTVVQSLLSTAASPEATP